MYSLSLRLALISLVTIVLYDSVFAGSLKEGIDPSPDPLHTTFDDFMNSFPKETPESSFDWIRSADVNDTLKPPYARSEKGMESNYVPVYVGISRTFYKQSVGEAILYKNGDCLTKVNAANPLRFLRIFASNGDVLAVSASHTEGLNGIAIALKIGEQMFLTGDTGYKAKSSFDSSRWNRPTYRACSWPQAVTQEIPPEKNLRNAEYVWAGQSVKKGAYLRFVIGGEDCSQTTFRTGKARRLKRSRGGKKGTKGSRPKKPRDQKHFPDSDRLVDPHSSVRQPRGLCDCKRVSHPPDSNCYAFTTLRSKNKKKWLKPRKSQKCVRRSCGNNYECAENGDLVTGRCVLKAAKFKVVMVKRLSKDLFKCKRILLKQPTMLLVPHVD